MAEVIKKAKAPIKPKKAVAEKAVAAKPAAKKVVAKKAATKAGIAIVKTVSQEEVAALAHQLWAEGGYQHGKHVDDWFRAEQELRSKAS